MTETKEGPWEVVVVGGGAAGLSAALTLARARRSVLVIDAGRPRNAPADAVHGLLALDGTAPLELLQRGRAEVTAYGGEVRAGEVTRVTRDGELFAVTLQDSQQVLARRLLVASGLVDELPDIPGVADRWGRDVLHCPYCHGWEVRDRAIGVLATGPMAVHQTLLFHQWSKDVRLFANDQPIDPADRAKLAALGIRIIEGAVAELEISADRLTGVRLADRAVADCDVVVVGPRMVARAAPFAALGIEPREHPMGSFIPADETGATAVPGVWAAGNSSDLSAQVSHAAAEGARAAAHLNADLVMQDADRAVSASTGTQDVA